MRDDFIVRLFKDSEYLAKKIAGYNNPDLEDIISECYLNACKAVSNYKDDNETGASLSTYIVSVIKNTIFAYKRKIKDRDRLYAGFKVLSRDEYIDNFDIDIVSAENQNKDDLLQIDILNKQLDKIRKNDVLMFNVVYKFFFEDKTLSQISKELNISIEKARQLKTMAIVLIRKGF